MRAKRKNSFPTTALIIGWSWSPRKKIDTDYPAGAYNVQLVISQSEPEKIHLYHFADGRITSFPTALPAQFRVVDAQGRELTEGPLQTKIEGDQQTPILALTLPFYSNPDGESVKHSGPPDKLIFRYNTDWRELVVPFEFKDVPLP